MAELIVCINNLTEYSCKDKQKLQSKCTLYTALNDSTTTIKDIVRWSWQIARYAFDFCETFSYCLYPINVYSARINLNGDIIMSSIFKHTKENNTQNYLLTANSMLGSYYIMLNNIDKANKTKEVQKELQILHILFEHIIANAKLNLCKNVVEGAFLIMDKMCELVESDIVADLNNIMIN